MSARPPRGTVPQAHRSAAESGSAAEGGGDNIELQMWLRLLACTNLVTAHLRRRLRHEFDVTLPIFDILAQIVRPPAGPTMGELSMRLMVSKGNVTELIERLTTKGLVRRSTDPQDARVQRVYLTAKGQQLFERLLPAHNEHIRALTTGLGAAKLRRLSAMLGEFRSLLQQAAERDIATPRRAASTTARTLPALRRLARPSLHRKG